MQDGRRDNAMYKALRRRGAHLLEAVRPPGVALKRKAPLPDRSASRLVDSPVFLLSSVRSGSTLLRVLLNSHSRIRAPHELHLRTLKVEPSREFSEDVMDALGLTRTELEHLLWDRILHYELVSTGKDVIVDKTPANALIWQRISSVWPNARYVFLQRHPASVVESVLNRRKNADRAEVVKEVLDYVTGVEEARRMLDGVTVKYEDLTADPARETQRICAYLGLPWEESMLDYGAKDHGPIRPVFGDWSKNIKSGKVQPARPLPREEDVPADLRDIARAWGYLS
ncbi:sulfotransferase family protein [Actinocorallia herbida]|uniref:Sulfotransferase family protein n=1 Tax=Actinocorallia herbida TaxID=58109 RepID=A0A3N1DBX0_9ACTN|nr:sulfotransferase [Actinocorallia herbida]ROO91021.1 sulfotransferase family protein [Actinocorallia herbida]